MNEIRKRRREIQQEKLRRKQLLMELALLEFLESTGWPMEVHIRKIGIALGDADDIPKYMPDDLSHEDFLKYEKLAAQNGIPKAVFRDRLKRKKTALQAATEVYNKKKKG